MSYYNATPFEAARGALVNHDQLGLKLPKRVTDAEALLESMRDMNAGLQKARSELVAAMLEALGKGVEPAKHPRVKDALIALQLQAVAGQVQSAAEAAYADAVRSSADELAAQLVPAFDKAVERLKAAEPLLLGLDPMRPDQRRALAQSPDVKVLTAMVEATEASEQIDRLGRAHHTFLLVAGESMPKGVGPYALVSPQVAAEYVPGSLDAMTALPPLTALRRGLELKLLSRAELEQWRQDHDKAEEARRQQHERRRTASLSRS